MTVCIAVKLMLIVGVYGKEILTLKIFNYVLQLFK
jgi:hypothetical protein